MIAMLRPNDNDLAIRRRTHNCPAFSGRRGRARWSSAKRQPSRAVSRISISSMPWGWNGGVNGQIVSTRPRSGQAALRP